MTAGPLLETRSVTQRFGGLVANRDISIEVHCGEILGLIGPNGAGKSTLFNLIAGTLPPTSGEIIMEGKTITGLPDTYRCRLGIARTFQVPRSFESMSVLDNVIVGALARQRGIAKARFLALETLEFVGLAERTLALAIHLTPPERRRLELARALATGPKLLLLDEVMAGLTPAEAQKGVDLIRRIRDRGITIVMVEHVMEVVMPLVDRTVVLNLGAVLAQGKPADVVRDERVIDAYLGERRRAA